jgi:hypothetical protein
LENGGQYLSDDEESVKALCVSDSDDEPNWPEDELSMEELQKLAIVNMLLEHRGGHTTGTGSQESCLLS